MKKVTFLLLGALCALAIAPIASADYTTNVMFTNVTKTSATVSIIPGNDDFATAVLNRQPVKLKYRKASDTKDTEIVLEYDIETNLPRPVSLTGLKEKTSYTIWLGHRATRTCTGEELCAAVYTKYMNQGFTLTTKGDVVKASLLTKKLSYGDKSSEVGILKKYLASKGYMKTSTTTTFDVPTLVGVIKFQLARNLEADGVIGTGGRAIINQELTTQANLLNQ